MGNDICRCKILAGDMLVEWSRYNVECHLVEVDLYDKSNPIAPIDKLLVSGATLTGYRAF